MKSDIEPKHFELISQFETTEHLSTETTIIDLEQLEDLQHTRSSKAFIHFKNINELFQFVFNDYYVIDLSYLPKPAILINDMSDMNQHSINGTLLNRCFEKLFEKISV